MLEQWAEELWCLGFDKYFHFTKGPIILPFTGFVFHCVCVYPLCLCSVRVFVYALSLALSLEALLPRNKERPKLLRWNSVLIKKGKGELADIRCALGLLESIPESMFDSNKIKEIGLGKWGYSMPGVLQLPEWNWCAALDLKTDSVLCHSGFDSKQRLWIAMKSALGTLEFDTCT